MHLSTIVLVALIGITGAQFIDWCSPIGHGRRPPHSRIVYGETAEKGELGYQVQIRWYGELVCGGTLIKVGPEEIQAVITAASCLSGPDHFFYSMQGGDWDLDNYMDDEQVREVDRVYFPDNYNKSRPYENDIALIQLNAPFDIGNMTRPIALPPQDQELNSNVSLLASGWGQWYPFLDEFTCRLQKIDIPQVDRDTCQQIYTEHGIELSDSMFCVGQMEGGDSVGVGVGPCGVDFGGPLVDVEAGYLAGVMSHNFRCAYVGNPVVSTKVSHYVNWIETSLNVTKTL